MVKKLLEFENVFKKVRPKGFESYRKMERFLKIDQNGRLFPRIKIIG